MDLSDNGPVTEHFSETRTYRWDRITTAEELAEKNLEEIAGYGPPPDARIVGVSTRISNAFNPRVKALINKHLGKGNIVTIQDEINHSLEEIVKDFQDTDLTFSSVGEFINKTSLNIEELKVVVEHKHYYERAYLNRQAFYTEEGAIEAGWIKLSVIKSLYHLQGFGNAYNVKYVSLDGKLEGVYKNGKLINDPVNMATYNYSSPEDQKGHFVNDMLPYYLLGNSPDDTTLITDRLNLIKIIKNVYVNRGLEKIFATDVSSGEITHIPEPELRGL